MASYKDGKLQHQTKPHPKGNRARLSDGTPANTRKQPEPKKAREAEAKPAAEKPVKAKAKE